MSLPDSIRALGTLLLAHPTVFAGLAMLCLAIGLGLGFWIGHALSVRRIRFLVAALEKRGEEIAELGARVTRLARVTKNPDAVFQNDKAVGRAYGFTPRFNEGYCMFDRIEGTGDFRPTVPFSYRDRDYRIESVAQMADGQMRGVRTQRFGKVKATPVP